jgi:hypothetical protein
VNEVKALKVGKETLSLELSSELIFVGSKES